MTLPEPDEFEQAHSAKLVSRIEDEICQQGGYLPFQRYMEMVLYEPGLGYYAAGAQKFGARGDFVTAPELSSLFSICLARQCAQVLETLTERACVLEIGAGSGVMAADILAELERLECLPDHYYILELSAELKLRQRETLTAKLPHLVSSVRWLDTLEGLSLHGVVLANEVLDAMPVQAFTVREEGVYERGVTQVDGRLQWTEKPAAVELVEQVRQLQQGSDTHWLLPYHSELNPQLAGWMQTLAGCMSQAALLLVDYGYPRNEYYHWERRQGTLIGHYHHRVTEDPFFYPGLQDLTANVDFSAVAAAGEQAGLALAGYTSQAFFLLGNGLDHVYQDQPVDNDQQRIELAREIKILTLPSEMGERFQAIGFTKCLDLSLQGFELRDMTYRL